MYLSMFISVDRVDRVTCYSTAVITIHTKKRLQSTYFSSKQTKQNILDN